MLHSTKNTRRWN